MGEYDKAPYEHTAEDKDSNDDDTMDDEYIPGYKSGEEDDVNVEPESITDLAYKLDALLNDNERGVGIDIESEDSRGTDTDTDAHSKGSNTRQLYNSESDDAVDGSASEFDEASMEPAADDTSSADESGTDGSEQTQDTAEQMDARYGARSGAHNLRPRRRPNYGHLFSQFVMIAASVATEQVGVKRGLKMFGSEGLKAVEKEMLQLHT